MTVSKVDDEIRQQARRAELARRSLLVAAVILATVVAGLLLYVVLLIRATQQTGSPVLKAVIEGQRQTNAIAKQNQDLAEQIKSCTTPEGECSKRNAASTSDLVGIPRGPINTVIVLAIGCADRPGFQDDAEIFDCVTFKLAALRKEEPK